MKQEVKDMQENYRVNETKLQDLTNEELVAEYQKTHNDECLKMLMLNNKGLIFILASNYSIPDHDLEDLMEEGYIALWKAADNYDPSRGYAFTSLLRGFVQQTYNRLYTNAHRAKRDGGEMPLSWEELEDINKEQSYTDDHTALAMEEIIGALTGATKSVAALLISGLSKGEVAKALGITAASVSYHVKKIQKAYIAYREVV